MNKPFEIYEEYRKAADFKSALGKRGLYEQNRINERFYIGDQWYGAKCGNDRPLVRHNIIKRIGDYKMSQILSAPLSVSFSAEGIPTVDNSKNSRNDEINTAMSALSDYYSVTAERVGLTSLYATALRNAYIGGTGILYTYWNGDIKTGLYADKEMRMPIKGDISCEVLNIENVYFGDPYISDVQQQPYIIIASCRETEAVLREARRNGADISTLRAIEEGADDGKVTVFTKLFKEYKAGGGYTIKSVKVTENAINRMITANVWSAMTTGMPMMVINGDTVPDGITNEPGQIVKVYGSNEEVSGAVKYVAPPDFSRNFDQSLQTLIDNTLTQSGANEVALGDSRADNATALITMQNAAIMPLQIVKNRFYSFAEEISRIWADFWISCYGKRAIKQNVGKGTKYFTFDADRLRGLIINAKIEVGTGTVYSERECVNTLLNLFEKGIIDKRQFLERLPDGIVPDRQGLLNTKKTESEENKNEGI